MKRRRRAQAIPRCCAFHANANAKKKIHFSYFSYLKVASTEKKELWIAHLLDYIFVYIFWIVNDLAIKLGRLIDQFMGNIYRKNVCIIWSSGVWIWVLFKNLPTYRNYLKTNYWFNLNFFYLKTNEAINNREPKS